MLDRIRGIRQPCDLDLLLFFHRHPTSLLTSEHLVRFVGYEQELVAKTLEGLIKAGLLTRSPNPAHAARMYALELRGPPGDSLLSVLEIAATRPGRQELMRLLRSPADGAPATGLSAPSNKIA